MNTSHFTNNDYTVSIDYTALAKSIILNEGSRVDYEALAKALLNEASRSPVTPQKRSRKQPPVHIGEDGTYEDHTMKPIKDPADIIKIRHYYLDRKLYNDHMLFVLGISVGLRVSDLLALRFIDVMDEDLNFRDSIMVPEKKTYKKRYFALSEVAKDSIRLYINEELHGRFSLDDYLFPFRRDAFNRESPTINPRTVRYILENAFKACGITLKPGTHTLRKTFAYHVLTGTNNPVERARRLEVLQHMLGHSTPLITLAYAGITRDEEADIYKNLDFGIKPVLPQDESLDAPAYPTDAE